MYPLRLPAGGASAPYGAGFAAWERQSALSRGSVRRVYPTRLETRTKESSMCASLLPVKGLGAVKAISKFGWIPPLKRGGRTADPPRTQS